MTKTSDFEAAFRRSKPFTNAHRRAVSGHGSLHNINSQPNMKALKSTFLLIFVLVLISCEKMEFKKDISGTWQFHGAGGGMGGGWYKTNTFSHLSLRKDRYSIYNSDTLKARGDYSINESNSNNSDYEPYYVNFKADQGVQIAFPFNRDLDVIIIHNDTLVFSERNVIDGQEFYFTRQ